VGISSPPNSKNTPKNPEKNAIFEIGKKRGFFWVFQKLEKKAFFGL
jgi:hypothetical protein